MTDDVPQGHDRYVLAGSLAAVATLLAAAGRWHHAQKQAAIIADLSRTEPVEDLGSFPTTQTYAGANDLACEFIGEIEGGSPIERRDAGYRVSDAVREAHRAVLAEVRRLDPRLPAGSAANVERADNDR